MKIALAGKGGSGKTTIAAILINLYRDAGYRVYAVDADPNRSLGPALGFLEEKGLTPILEMKKLIQEKMCIEGQSFAPMFKLNPDLEDVPEKYAIEKDGIRLMILGGLKAGGSGCACPENVFFKNLLHEVITGTDEVVIADMEAGLEHLSRGTAGAVDALLIVTEPSRAGLDVAARAELFAEDLKINNILYLGNKIRTEKERKFLEDNLPGILGFLPFSEEMLDGEREGIPASGRSGVISKELEKIRIKIEEMVQKSGNPRAVGA